MQDAWILVKLRRALRRTLPTLPEPRAVHKTSFLDGLRGVAALIVTVNHHIMGRRRYFHEPYWLGPYAQGEDPMDYTNPIQLPILRILVTGGAMVPIFFVISGYVLSFRQVRMIRERNTEKLAESLFSLAFRRPFRLFLPSLGAIVMYQTINELGWNVIKVSTKPWIGARIMWQICLLFQGIWGVQYPQKTLWMQIQQIWTIPLEYFGSMCVFVMLLINARIKYAWRMLFIVGSTMMAFYVGHWSVACFLGGMFIAELEPAESESELIYESKSKKRLVSAVRGSLFNVFWFMTLIMGLWLAGWPEAKFQKDPILSKLPGITPKHLAPENGTKWFWLGISGIQIVWAIFQSPRLQRIFTTRIALYLGDISYSLYIVHYHWTLTLMPMVHTYADSLFGVDRGTHMNQLLAVSFELSILFYVSIWQADFYWKWVDKPCVRFSKWVESKARM